MGFFDFTDTPKQSKNSLPIETLHGMRCKVCPRNKAALLSPKMKPTGARRKKCDVYILGEAPGENEDQHAQQFIGRAGQFLRQYIPSEYDDRIRWNNTIRCRPPDNRDPLPVEVECCRGFQEEDIAEHKPKVVIGVGLVPLRWLLGDKLERKNNNLVAWRGRLFPVNIGGHVCWYMCLAHPSFVMRTQKEFGKSEHELEFERDLARVFDFIGGDDFEKAKIFTPNPNHKKITVLSEGTERDLKKMKAWLRKASRDKFVGFDYETTGIRPFAEGSRILTSSVTRPNFETLAFPVDHPKVWKSNALRKKAVKLVGRFIAESGTKVCHNAKFEQEWSGYFYGMDVVKGTGWHDTQALAYIHDSRKGMLSLDVQCFLEFGFWLKDLFQIDYGNMISAPMERILPYNALDTFWTVALFKRRKKQVRRMGKHLLWYAAHLVRVGVALAGAQLIGVSANLKARDKLDRMYCKKLAKLERKFEGLKSCRRFEKKFGYTPRIDKADDLGKLFADLLKVDGLRTAKGNISTAEDKLGGLDQKKYPEAKIVLEYRSLRTIKGTFIDGVDSVLWPDGKFHTSYNHLFVATNRLSSNDPNLQNQPKKKHKKIRAIFSEKGKDLASFDYGQIEARVIAMASHDKAFCDALWAGLDVHANWTDHFLDAEPLQLYKHKLIPDEALPRRKTTSALRDCCKEFLDDPKMRGDHRNIVKNKWVFPLFFGSSKYSVVNDMRLEEKNGEKFFQAFWDEFEGVKKWHRRVLRQYEKKGYVENLMGFRRYGPLGYNEIINTPIQSTAGFIANNAFERLLYQEDIQFNLQVHDDLSFFMEPDVLEEKQPIIARYMCDVPFDWVIVPLVVEVEVGSAWHNQKKVVEYHSYEDFGIDPR